MEIVGTVHRIQCTEDNSNIFGNHFSHYMLELISMQVNYKYKSWELPVVSEWTFARQSVATCKEVIVTQSNK